MIVDSNHILKKKKLMKHCILVQQLVRYPLPLYFDIVKAKEQFTVQPAKIFKSVNWHSHLNSHHMTYKCGDHAITVKVNGDLILFDHFFFFFGCKSIV